MITASTISDGEDSGALDLQVVEQLVELRDVDSGAETARLRSYPETWSVARRRRAGAEAAPKGLVDHDFQRLSRASRHRLQLFGDIVIEGEGGPHEGIMMPSRWSVKMLDPEHLHRCSHRHDQTRRRTETIRMAV